MNEQTGPEKGLIAEKMGADLAGLSAETSRAPDETLVLACRILAAEGHSSGLAGQITSRAGEGEWLTLPLGVGFDEARTDDVIRVDRDLVPLDGGTAPNPAVRFHVWVYGARPDVQAIVHTHPQAASALSMTGRALEPMHMDAAMFYEDCAFLAEWPGVPIADEEGRIISEALGDRRAILLAHHGLLTAAASLEEATYLAVFFERACRRQLDAMAANGGEIRPVTPELGREAHDFMLKPEIVRATFDYFARQAIRREPDLASMS